MTREEIRIQTMAQLERISGMLGSMGEKKDWTEYAIKALEQEPILDKIRAEIKQLPTSTCSEIYRMSINADDFKENVLAIFDKYRGESEET